MNRNEMVSVAARTLWDRHQQTYWDAERDRRPFDLNAVDTEAAEAASDLVATVREVLDAILPQITTVEELDAMYEAADPRILLVDRDGGAHRLDTIGAEVVEECGPLTVVWRPE